MSHDTEYFACKPISPAGFLAILRAFLDGRGSGASFVPRRFVGASLLAVAVVFAFAGAPALAVKVYVPGIPFGAAGSGDGQFEEPAGVAVNDSNEPLVEPAAGDVYVVDKGNDRVERFSSTGEYKGQFNGSGEFETEGKKETGPAAPTGAFSSPAQVAVDNSGSPLTDPSAGDVYVLDTGHDVIDKFSATGEYKGQFTPADTCNPACTLGKKGAVGGGGTVTSEQLLSITVDPSGNLWTFNTITEEFKEGNAVLSGGGFFLNECSDSGSCTTQSQCVADSGCGGSGIAVDPSETVYTIKGGSQIEKSSSTTGDEEASIPTEHASALAVDFSTRDLLVDEESSIVLFGPIVEEHQSPIETFAAVGLSGSYGIAMNGASADRTIYASEGAADKVETFDYIPLPAVATEAASGVSPTAMTLHGSVNPEGQLVKECYFEYGTEAGVYTNRAACEQTPAEINTTLSKGGTAPAAVSVALSGLPPSGVRSFRLAAASANGTLPAAGVTISRPTTTGESLSNVSVIAATLSAQVDPGGLATSYHLEYGTSTAYGASTPEENIGSANQSVGVRVILTGLQPGTQYHWRVVARNALGTVDGPDVTFATYAPVAGLPDGRVYEPVGPVASSQDVNIYIPNANVELSGFNEHGIPGSSLLPFQAAAGGEMVVYAGDPPPTGGTSAGGEGLGNEYLATRSPGGGWTQVALETSSQNETGPTGSGEHAEYRAFTGDLSVGILEGPNAPVTGTPLLEYKGGYYKGLYAHATAGGVDGEYESLLTTVPDRTAKELSTVVGNHGGEQAPYAGANAGTAVVRAYSHLLFESNADLLEGEGQLEKEVREDVGKEVAAGQYSEFTHYLYDNVGGKLYLIDVLPNGSVAPGGAFGSIEGAVTSNGEPGGGPGFTHVISADGSRVFWTYAPEASPAVRGDTGPVFHRSRALYVRENDTRPQSPVGPEEECLVAADACTVQVDAAVGGEGIFQDASTDGSKVFFTKGDLYEYDLEDGETTDLSPGVTVKGVAGIGDNGEYVYYVDSSNDIVLWHAGVTTLVAAGAANSSDYSVDGTASDYAEEIGSRTAEVTPDGQSLVFMSDTGVEQVFLYEAGSGSHPPTLTCVSCDPTGEAPVSTNASVGPSNHSVGAVLPRSLQATYQPRWISEDGSRVFFESAQPLVAQATNGWLDVYEWERDGTGSCQLSQGCIFLLSSGSDPENSYLLDASADGDDVFIVTRAELVAQDRNDLDDVYDVRVGGVRPGVAPACSGTGCQGVPPAPPIFATPASVTFEGVGNFAAPLAASRSGSSGKSARCRSGFVKRNGRCVKKRSAKRAKKRRAKRATGPAKKAGRSSGHSKGRI